MRIIIQMASSNQYGGVRDRDRDKEGDGHDSNDGDNSTNQL